jgi:hypothetical protein
VGLQEPRILKIKKGLELCFGGLFQRQRPEIEDGILVDREDRVACDVDLGNGEGQEGMRERHLIDLKALLGGRED